MDVNPFDVGRFQFGALGRCHAGIEAWLEKEVLEEVVMSRSIGLRIFAGKHERLGGEAGDGRPVPRSKREGLDDDEAAMRRRTRSPNRKNSGIHFWICLYFPQLSER